MRMTAPKNALVLVMLAAGWVAVTPAFADDSDGEATEQLVPGIAGSMPGMRALGAPMQRPAAENPEMRSFAPVAPAAAPAIRPAAAPAATPPDMPAQPANWQDVDQLLQQVEAELKAHHGRAAEATLEVTETVLLNARAAGMELPAQALDPVIEARTAVHHGHVTAAMRATELARQAVAG